MKGWISSLKSGQHSQPALGQLKKSPRPYDLCLHENQHLNLQALKSLKTMELMVEPHQTAPNHDPQIKTFVTKTTCHQTFFFCEE
jgi:hypothetical protein